MQQITYGSQVLQKAEVLGYQSACSIDKLIENIGLDESKKLLTEALPIIVTRKGLVLKALDNNEISKAGEYAHRTSGSIRLYGSSRLEELLREVMSLTSDQTVSSGLRNELSEEFDAAISEIQNRVGTSTA